MSFIEQILKTTYSQKARKKLPKNHIPFHKNHYETRILCKKCMDDRNCRNGRSKSYFNTASLTKHILAKHDKVRNLPPTYIDIFIVLEKIAIALESGIRISTIPQVKLWKMEVQ